MKDYVVYFNSFFYTKYTQGTGKSRSYDLVKKWAKVDIFSKRYIVIPINLENTHWILVIVSCNIDDQHKPFMLVFDSLGNDNEMVAQNINE